MASTSNWTYELLLSCYHEADRCDFVSYELDQLHHGLKQSGNHRHLAPVIAEIKTGSGILRELADLSQVHQERSALILNSLNIALPCLSRSLRDIRWRLEDGSRPDERWRNMYYAMAHEVGDIPLKSRFTLYNEFLGLVRDFLVRSPSFNFRNLERRRYQVLYLRDARNILPPSPIASLVH